MLNTWTFMVFVIAVWLIYWWIVPLRGRSFFLALVSFGYFYVYYPREMVFLLGLSLVVYLIGFLIWVTGRRYLMIGSVALLVSILAYFKYAAFLADIVNDALGPLLSTPVVASQIIIPLGISYFTFKMIHYLVDIYAGKIADHHLFQFVSYIFFFPILVSGPIERFQPFLAQNEVLGASNSGGQNSPVSGQGSAQLDGRADGAFANLKRRRGFDLEDVYTGLPRIIFGLFKKVVLADSLAATALLLQQPDLAAGQYWLASLAYTLQLYFDFSGYSDMAIGISRLFGYRIMENFNWPYLARNLSDFWKRWHMSLTGWFRDYVFIPLGGSRGSLGFVIRNTLIVMAVTGLWHGAGYHFIFWGLYHALGLIILRLYRRYLVAPWASGENLLNSRTATILGILLTFGFVNIGWIFFACPAEQSIYVLRHMFAL